LTEETNKRLEKIRNYRQVMEKKEAAAGETENAEVLHEEEREGWTDEMKKDLEIQAEKNVRIGLALGKVIELEGLSKSENAMRDALTRLIELAAKK
jgi:FKBP-type peptidyl-prolyl cis-trans isomerase (trigger factor)